METLTKQLPFDETKTGTTSGAVKQYMIVLTDGRNTQNRFTTNSAEIDARALQACNNAKQLVDEVYTIRVIDGNEDLLRECASDEDKFFNITDASQLNEVFEDIAESLRPVRLTN